MLENFMNWTPIVTAVWLIGIALIMETENIKSAMIFKVIPFFLGLSCLFVGLKGMGVL